MMVTHLHVPQYYNYTWPKLQPKPIRSYYRRPFDYQCGYHQDEPSILPHQHRELSPYYLPVRNTTLPGIYGYPGFFTSPDFSSVPEVFATTIPGSGLPKFHPDSALYERESCAVCREKNDRLQTNSESNLPLDDYSSSPSPWTNKSDKISLPTNRLTCRKLCHIKERKELLIRVYLILLVDLLLCYLFCVVFHIIMREELNVIKDEKPWLKWTPLIVYLACCSMFVCFPAKVLKYRLGSYAMIIAITYSLCFGTGWLALEYFWEVLASLVCITITLLILIILLWWLPISDVVSPIGFGLTEALLLIFFGLTTLALQYAYFISIKTLILVYLITLLLPMYILMDSWLIIEGMRFTVIPIESVVAAVITLCTDFAMMPVVSSLFFFKRQCYMELKEKSQQDI